MKRAIADIAQRGLEKAYQDFNDRNGAFRLGELYISVLDFHGRTHAHGGNAGLIGKNQFDYRDAYGKYFVRETISLLSEKESGWVDFRWMNPVTQRVEPKSAYCQRVGERELFVTCGIYKGDEQENSGRTGQRPAVLAVSKSLPNKVKWLPVRSR